MRDVERLTQDFRHAQATALRERALELGLEAWRVLEAVGEARRTPERQWCDLGRMWDAMVNGDRASWGDSEVARVVSRWDSELASRPVRARPDHPDDETPSRLLPDLAHPRGDALPEHWRDDWRAAGLFRALDSAAADVPRRGFDSWLECVAREAQRRLDSSWHSDRAKALEETFQRASTCNTIPRGKVRCECGHAIELKEECNNRWVCQHCRDRRKRHYRNRFRAAREATLQELRHEKLAFGQGARGFFAERFLTLTMPRAEDAEAGCQIIRKAWRLFWGRVRAAIVRRYAGHLSKRARAKYANLVRVVRVIEVAEGEDHTGHVHIHAWFVSPFIRAEVLRAMWGVALLKAGFPRELVFYRGSAAVAQKTEVLASVGRCDWSRRALRRLPQELFYPRLDIRVVRPDAQRVKRNRPGLRVVTRGEGTMTPADICEEIIKYVCKDLGVSGKPLDARLWASIYRGLATARVITASHGFWVRIQQSECPCCGQTDWRVELAPRPVARAQSPPLLRLIGGSRTH